jgi:hypothetical protein
MDLNHKRGFLEVLKEHVYLGNARAVSVKMLNTELEYLKELVKRDIEKEESGISKSSTTIIEVKKPIQSFKV